MTILLHRSAFAITLALVACGPAERPADGEPTPPSSIPEPVSPEAVEPPAVRSEPVRTVPVSRPDHGLASSPHGQRFDLECEPLRDGTGGAGVHYDKRWSVDLLNRQWCDRQACLEGAGVDDIASIDDDSITLLDRNQSTLVFRYGRDQMTFTGYWGELVWQCRRERFTGWWEPLRPAPPFEEESE